MEKHEVELLKSELQKLYYYIRKLGKPEILDEMLKTLNGFGKAGQNVMTLFSLGKRVSNKREYSVLNMAGFLWTFEGLYVSRLDLVSLLLVRNGHDLFNLSKREYASSLKEISEVDISTKFKFLESHNLGMLIRKEDQRLRNRIAHHDFELDENGNISIDSQVLDLDSRLHYLNDFIIKLGQILRDSFSH